MRITVTRSGGFAGLTREWSVQVSLQADRDWQELLERLPWDGVRATAVTDVASGEPDRFVYRVRCANQEATLPERRLTGPWRELVDRVQQSAEADSDRSGHRDE